MDLDQAVERAARIAGATDDRARVARIASAIADRPLPRRDVEARIDELEGYGKTLAALLLSPGIPQRTPEWYAARERMVTASELASATAASSRRRFFLRKLAGPDAWNDLKDKPAIRWGVKYEPVACEVYARRSGGARVHEFGLLPHPSVEGFGASPDGINDLGIMLEIKCPYTRVIDDEVPPAYRAQMQAQLDTAGLGECDFVQVKFEEYGDERDFAEDTHPSDPSLTRAGAEKGAVLLRGDEHEFEMGEGAAAWARERPGAALWRVVVYSRRRVRKDDAFVESLKPGIDAAVRDIRRYRDDPGALDRELPDKHRVPSFAFRL